MMVLHGVMVAGRKSVAMGGADNAEVERETDKRIEEKTTQS